MHKDDELILIQKSQPFGKKIFSINKEKRRLKVIESVISGTSETYYHLFEIDEYKQIIHQRAVWSLMFALFTSFFVIVAALMFKGKFSLIAACTVIPTFFWINYYRNSYQIWIYFNKYNGRALFSIAVNRPNAKLFEAFITELNQIISECNEIGLINAVMESLSTPVLVNEFSVSYMNELYKRGVDIHAMLQFLEKRIKHQIAIQDTTT